MYHNSTVKVAQSRLRYNFQKDMYKVFDIDNGQCMELCDILLDLINYEDIDIRLMSIELLYNIYGAEHILLADATQVYFTTSYSDAEVYTEMKQVATMTDEDQLLSKMLKRQVKDIPKLLNKLNQFAIWCISDQDETEPNVCNQGVAYSCGKLITNVLFISIKTIKGLFAIVLEYVLEYGSSKHYDQEEILCTCFLILQKITRKNPVVSIALHLLVDCKLTLRHKRSCLIISMN